MTGAEKLMRQAFPTNREQEAYHRAIEVATGMKVVRLMGKWELVKRKN